RVAMEFQLQCLSHSFTREVILDGTQTAHENHDIRPRQRCACAPSKVLAAISNNGLEDHFHPELIEFFGEIQRVRILAERRQQVGADSNDFGIHVSSLNDRYWKAEHWIAECLCLR